MKRLVIINIILMILIHIIPIEEDITNIQVATIQENRIVETVSSRSLEEPITNNVRQKSTNISQEGIDLIKQFEGLKLQAYLLDGEKYWTIRIWNT